MDTTMRTRQSPDGAPVGRREEDDARESTAGMEPLGRQQQRWDDEGGSPADMLSGAPVADETESVSERAWRMRERASWGSEHFDAVNEVARDNTWKVVGAGIAAGIAIGLLLGRR